MTTRHQLAVQQRASHLPLQSANTISPYARMILDPVYQDEAKILLQRIIEENVSSQEEYITKNLTD